MSTAVPAGEPRTGPLTPATPAGIVVRSYIDAQVDVLDRAIGRLQRHESGSVGRTSTAVVRIRSAVRGYRHLFVEVPRGGERLEHLLADLKHAEDLEALRDHFTERLAGLGLAAERFPRWHTDIDLERREAYFELDRVSTQAWVAVLLEQVRLFAARARFTAAGRRPASSLMGVLTRAKYHLLDVYSKQRLAADPVEARDGTREAAREAHYLAEAVHPAFGRAAGEVIVPASNLEHLLSRYRLSLIAGNRLRRLPAADRADPLTVRLAEIEQEHRREMADQMDELAAALAERWR
ncbi:CHAD domain-containing protein [Glycomyces xiaoerkulensis]|uniref:CHAD domain-containing protein n=1 Tax=Glycomyces xiaoerkulensis TaxID=2038139 RepID=UPI000C25D408|nr:CHAD domain-containing protein [Glycomyces xiaoerkulensis]